MSDLLVSSLASLKSAMTESFGDMRASLVVEESPATEGTELQMAQPDEQATRAILQQRTVATEPETVEKGQKSDSTDQSITKLTSQSSDPYRWWQN